MRKLTKRSQMMLYAVAGMGVNMLNLMMGSYLCSALIASGFSPDVIGNQTFLGRDLVIAAVWAVFGIVAKIIDGIIDIPMASFADNLKTRFGRRRPAIIIGMIPMIISYVLFTMVTPNPMGETLANTVYYGIMLCIFYSFYTLTMVTYYATFTEIVDNVEDRNFISNVKSVCDILYFILGYVVVRMMLNNMNVRTVSMIVLPIVLTMLIPLFLIKEKSTVIGDASKNVQKTKAVSLIKSISYTFKNKTYIKWMIVYSFMTLGVQLFLSGINEYFSVSGMSMILVMLASFAPVPFTLILYNKLTKKKGFGFSFRYTLCIFAIGMIAMFLVSYIPTKPAKFSYTYEVTQADVEAGQIESSITARGLKADGSEETATSTIMLYTTNAFDAKAVNANPNNSTLYISHSASKNINLKAGDIITFTAIVRNDGKEALRDINVDASHGIVEKEAFTLQPGSAIKTPLAILTGLISSFGIGALFSVAYSIPSELAAEEEKRTGISNAAMYFAVQGLFAGIASGIGGQALLTLMKELWIVEYLTLVCGIAILIALILTFILPKSLMNLGKEQESDIQAK